MTATTVSQGYVYPLITDQADLPGQLYSFASAVDADLAGWDSLFTSVTKSKSFRVRMPSDVTLAASGAATLAFTTVDIDKTGGWVFNSSGFISAAADAGWWFLGVTLIVQTGTGTVTTTTSNRYYLDMSYVDPATGRVSEITRAGDDIEENNNTPGGYINVSTLNYFPGQMLGTHSFYNTDTTSQRIVKAGSTFYGLRLGS